ncbi:PAS domain-containing protein [Streptomyces marispadix]|uniref:PAS domain-containing protein n=1 Tax=Streptomyces marispadix TaxID=2922868 RepID=A0ABS9SZE1_9ACTN|nr:PAS domain-containing protein [Streptomyces marispadix]MCH6161643.1 PAS domain-containing protein [Streptomyces marispadix]
MSRPSRGAARLAAILDALPDALLLVNCNGTVVNANTIALEAFEAPGTALVGRGLLDLLPEFDSKRIPGSMRRPDEAAAELEQRQRPTRMVARRTDGSEFYVEVTSANLEDGRTPYASAFEAAFADHGPGSGNSYTGDELLMLVVRDLTGTLDTEAELARQQRQTEMILRAASEGVIGVDTDGVIVLVNPAAAQILGYRAGELGGQELHSLVLHSRPDGNALPFEETTLSDTLKSGRKHRVRAGTVLWAKDGQAVPVDITTAPVRDGEQLVGAVVTFSDRRAHESLAARHEQLLAVLQDSLRGPLDQLRDELSGLAADPAGQLWPEANQILHHLAAGYTRMTTLVDNVLGYQRLDAGREKLRREMTSLDSVVANGVEGAVELIGPGRAQFAVHAPPIEAEVDGERLTTALAHLIADVAGVDATGNAPVAAPGLDTTIVVAAAQRGDVVRIEVRGPYDGGDPVHLPIVRGTVERHGGVLQTHEVPGAGGSAYVLEVPLKADTAGGADGAGASGGAAGGAGDTAAGQRGREGRENETTVMPVPAQPVRGTEAAAEAQGSGAAGAWTGTGDVSGAAPAAGIPDQFQARHARGPAPAHAQGAAHAQGQTPVQQEQQAEQSPSGQEEQAAAPTGRRRGRPSPAEAQQAQAQQSQAGQTQAGQVPQEQQQGDVDAAGVTVPQQAGAGRRSRRALASPTQGAEAEETGGGQQPQAQPGTGRRARRPVQGQQGQPAQSEPVAAQSAQPGSGDDGTGGGQPGGRRARRLAQAQGQAGGQAGGQAEGEQTPQGVQFAAPPGQPQPAEAQAVQNGAATTGNGAALPGAVAEDAAPGAQPVQQNGAHPQQVPAQPVPAQPVPAQPPQPAQSEEVPQEAEQQEEPQAVEHTVVAASPILGGGPLPQNMPQPRGLPMPGAPTAEEQASYETGHHRVQTLGQGIPVTPGMTERPGGQHSYGHSATHAPTPSPRQAHAPAPATAIPSTPSTPPGSGRRRKLAAPAQDGGPAAGRPGSRKAQAQGRAAPAAPGHAPGGGPGTGGGSGGGAGTPPPAREFSIGAPAAGTAEGPEPLDGPNSPVEMSNGRGVPVPPQAVDDELPPEPLDNPRRLLVWPEPDPATQQALSAHGYRPVIVHSREEVDSQISSYPAALFVDPLTGPITRTALQSLRSAAVAAEVPVMVTSGLGQATREAAYGADPAVLLKALAPRDSEQHPPRVLLIEERPPIAGAMAASLERRGIQVAHAPTDEAAVNVAAQMRPNLVVMDLMQVRTRRTGIIDWLRVNGLLSRTPFVVYTSEGMNPADLPRLATGETVLFLAERSTSQEVQQRIVDMLTKIGAN